MYALYYREKTGRGQLVDISMQDVAFSINIGAIVESVLGEEKVGKIGISTTRYPPGIKLPLYGIYPTIDGDVAICALTEAQAKRLFEVMGKEELADDERFSNFISRFDHEEELNEIVNGWTSKMKRDEVVQKLIAVRIPCGPVYSVSEVKNDEQLRAREMFVETYYKKMKFPVPGVCVKLSESPGSVKSAPELGQHNEEVLSFLGYTRGVVEELKKSGVI